MLEFERILSGLPDSSPFPSGFGFGILRTDGGNDEVIEESSPGSYFYANSGYGVFDYTEDVGPPLDRHGLLASPGNLDGIHHQVSLIFADPTRDFDPSWDEVVVEIGLGVRGDGLKEWVGGFLESKWTPGGGWNPLWKLSAVQVDGTTITNLGSNTNEPPYQALNSLTVKIVGDDLTVSFNGVEQVTATVILANVFNFVVLWGKVYFTKAAVTTPIPFLERVVGESLYSGRQHTIKEIPNHYVEPPTTGVHFYELPVRDLEDEGALVKLTERSWMFTKDITIPPEDRPGFAASKGAVIVGYRMDLRDARNVLCKVRW